MRKNKVTFKLGNKTIASFDKPDCWGDDSQYVPDDAKPTRRKPTNRKESDELPKGCQEGDK
jgi:hypothetical protein